MVKVERSFPAPASLHWNHRKQMEVIRCRMS